MKEGYGVGVYVCDSRHENTVTWSVSDPDDVGYQIDIDVARDAGGSAWESLVTGLSTYDTQYVHPEWGIVATGGAIPKYWKYQVKVMPRAGGGAVGPTPESSQIYRPNTQACAYNE